MDWSCIWSKHVCGENRQNYVQSVKAWSFDLTSCCCNDSMRVCYCFTCCTKHVIHHICMWIQLSHLLSLPINCWSPSHPLTKSRLKTFHSLFVLRWPAKTHLLCSPICWRNATSKLHMPNRVGKCPKLNANRKIQKNCFK